MVDHLAWARRYRNRAASCQISAGNTSSSEFRDCYNSLAQYFILLANLEEDFVRRASTSPDPIQAIQSG